jgi:endonuclease/exonuclease/phosphatase family metal-dependent hydrolase
MYVQLFTFNQGKSGALKYVGDWQRYLKAQEADLLSRRHDIKAFSVQESGSKSPILRVIRKLLKTDYDVYHKTYGSFMAPSFYVHMLVAVRKGHRAAVRMSAWRHNLLGSKSTVGALVKAMGTKVLVCASHLPFDLNNPKERIEAMKSVMKATSAKWGSPDAILWMGDLNFRIVDGKNQIHDALDVLQRATKTRFEALPIEDHMHPTCKLTAASCSYAKANGARINRSTCYDARREPSYCDRILVSGSSVSDLDVSVLPRTAPVDRSDHLPVLVEFRLEKSRLDNLDASERLSRGTNQHR